MEEQEQRQETKEVNTSFAADTMDKETANFIRWAIDPSDFLLQLKANLQGYEFKEVTQEGKLLFEKSADPLMNDEGIHSILLRAESVGKDLRLSDLNENEVSIIMEENLVQIARSLFVSQKKFSIKDGDNARTIFISVSNYLVGSIKRPFNDGLWKNIRQTTQVKEAKIINQDEKKGVGLFGKG